MLIFWLVVWTPLKNISQLGLLFPIYGKIKNVPNHQPVLGFVMTCSKHHVLHFKRNAEFAIQWIHHFGNTLAKFDRTYGWKRLVWKTTAWKYCTKSLFFSRKFNSKLWALFDCVPHAHGFHSTVPEGTVSHLFCSSIESFSGHQTHAIPIPL